MQDQYWVLKCALNPPLVQLCMCLLYAFSVNKAHIVGAFSLSFPACASLMNECLH